MWFLSVCRYPEFLWILLPCLDIHDGCLDLEGSVTWVYVNSAQDVTTLCALELQLNSAPQGILFTFQHDTPCPRNQAVHGHATLMYAGLSVCASGTAMHQLDEQIR